MKTIVKVGIAFGIGSTAVLCVQALSWRVAIPIAGIILLSYLYFTIVMKLTEWYDGRPRQHKRSNKR